MRLLIIAPKSDLNTMTEVMDAVGGESKILHGNVGIREVLTEIRTGNYTALHFAGHGSSTILQFSDGPLNKSLLAEAVQQAGTINIAILNACQSLGVAMALYGAGVHYVIGWQGDVPNDAAVNYAYSFWGTYKLSQDVHQAHRTGWEAVIFQHPGVDPPDLLNGRNVGYQRQIDELTTRTIQQKRWIHVLGALTGLSLVTEAVTLWMMWTM